MLAVCTNYGTPDCTPRPHCEVPCGYAIEQSYGQSSPQQNAWSGLPQASAQQEPKQFPTKPMVDVSSVPAASLLRKRSVKNSSSYQACKEECLRRDIGYTFVRTGENLDSCSSQVSYRWQAQGRLPCSVSSPSRRFDATRARSVKHTEYQSIPRSFRSEKDKGFAIRNASGHITPADSPSNSSREASSDDGFGTANSNQYQKQKDQKSFVDLKEALTLPTDAQKILPVLPEAKQVQQVSKAIPSLISEKHRKAAFVENLVGTAATVIEFVWSHFTINPSAKIIPLRVFLQETLRHSHTSYSTLQTALFYLYRIKPRITERAFRPRRPPTPPAEGSTAGWNANHNNDPATCGRRMFLAALIVASKYLQDQSYNNKAWSTISGLSVQEINANEMEFLQLIDYNLFIGEDIFKRWSSLLLSHIQAISGFDVKNGNALEYQREKERFRETLGNLDPNTMAPCPWTPDSSNPGSPL